MNGIEIALVALIVLIIVRIIVLIIARIDQLERRTKDTFSKVQEIINKERAKK